MSHENPKQKNGDRTSPTCFSISVCARNLNLPKSLPSNPFPKLAYKTVQNERDNQQYNPAVGCLKGSRPNAFVMFALLRCVSMVYWQTEKESY